MHQVIVDLADRSYPILIGPGVIDRVDAIVARLKQPQVAIVTNETIAPLYLERVRAPLAAAGVAVTEVILPDGEVYKNWETLNRIFDGLLAAHCERGATLVALGGGVIGDMGGFAAACYQRGMSFIQVPTTLLAQVDSSVGGKTAINHPLGKNMIGAFYQPSLVLADTAVLDTLPDRELSAGLAEVIKYGLIRDAAFFAWLEGNIDALRARDQGALVHAVEVSCRHKAAVVAADEREAGERALLNLGHTFGHAIEAGMGYGAWLHGEAVAAGTVMAARLSADLGWLAHSELTRIESLFRRAGLPVSGPALGANRYLELMQHDKKVVGGRLKLVLLKSIGQGLIYGEASPAVIAAAIDACVTSA